MEPAEGVFEIRPRHKAHKPYQRVLRVDERIRLLAEAVLAFVLLLRRIHRKTPEIVASNISFRFFQNGDARPGPLGGDRRSGRVEVKRALILSMLEQTPVITVQELRRALAARGHQFGYDTIQRFFMRHRITRKKRTGHAAEQDRPDVLRRRRAWFDGQIDLDSERLVFIDETWAMTNMVRTHGRAPRRDRLRMGVPHGHWKTTTFVAGLTLRGMIVPFVLSGPNRRAAFETYGEKVRVPELRPCDIVIMDNLSSHKGPRTQAMIEDAGARLRFPQPYSPNFNPIENAFAKLKAMLRKAAERAVEGLWSSIGRITDTFTPSECKNYFANAGYDPEW